MLLIVESKDMWNSQLTEMLTACVRTPMGGSALLETSHWYSDPSSSLLGRIVTTLTVSPSLSGAGTSFAGKGWPSPFLTQVMEGAGLPPREEQVRVYSCPSTASLADFTTVGC